MVTFVKFLQFLFVVHWMLLIALHVTESVDCTVIEKQDT